MSPRRLALLALVALALAPGAARAAIPVGLYPVRVPGLTLAQRSDVHAQLEAALASAARRGILAPRRPLVLAATCGDAMAPPCLGAAARDGLVLVARGELKGAVVLVTAALHDRNGARTREIRFLLDLVIENLRPAADALAQLELEIEPDGTVTGSKPGIAAAPPAPRPVRLPSPPATRPAIPLPPPPVANAAPPPPPVAKAAPLPPPVAKTAPPPALAARPPAPPPAPAAAKPKAVDLSAPAPASARWKRQAGPLFTILGGALLAGGATVAVVNARLADDLDRKHAAGTLTAADRSSYDRVHRYNVLTAVLLSAGGASAVAGTWIWITAPSTPGGGAVAVAGGSF